MGETVAKVQAVQRSRKQTSQRPSNGECIQSGRDKYTAMCPSDAKERKDCPTAYPNVEQGERRRREAVFGGDSQST